MPGLCSLEYRKEDSVLFKGRKDKALVLRRDQEMERFRTVSCFTPHGLPCRFMRFTVSGQIPPDVMALFPRDLTLNFTCSAMLFMAPNNIEELQITHLTSYLPYLSNWLS